MKNLLRIRKLFHDRKTDPEVRELKGGLQESIGRHLEGLDQAFSEVLEGHDVEVDVAGQAPGYFQTVLDNLSALQNGNKWVMLCFFLVHTHKPQKMATAKIFFNLIFCQE